MTTKRQLFFILFTLLVKPSTSIYLINVTNAAKNIERNPAIWTEDQSIWGPLLEDWTLSDHRDGRVMLYTETAQNTSDSLPKESKISPGKIIVNNNKPPSSKPITSKPLDHHVSEADIYLLNAIEKLVFRVDTLEKRVKTLEEMVYYMMAGNRIDHVPCPNNFTRIANTCYSFHSAAGREQDWKAASRLCKKYGAKLTELESIEENQDVINYLQTQVNLKGKDFWTGGLNPGLLWIWSNTARPVVTDNKKQASNILGDGRCLRLAYDSKTRTYNYRGTDCGRRYNYICEIEENDSSNEIRRLGRSKNILEDLN